MRVVLVVTRFPQLSETFIVSKFLGLLDLGWDVHVVCQWSEDEAWEQYPELRDRPDFRRRVHVAWSARPRRAVFWRYPAALAKAATAAPKHLSRYLVRTPGMLGAAAFKTLFLDARVIESRPSLVHFEFGALAVGRMYLPEALGAKTVVSFRGYDLNMAGLDEPDYFGEVFRGADALHLLGEDLWRRAIRRGCPPDTAHELIPPAIDTSFWSQFAVVGRERPPVASGGRLRLVSVGRLEWKKGYEWMLAALPRLQDRGVDAEITIIGDGAYSGAVRLAVHQLGLDGTTTMAGPLPRAEVRRVLAGADVFVHGAVSEGFCNAVLEAQAMGLPVVTTDADGLPENVVDGVTGFVVPRRDPEAMAEALYRIAADPELRRRMGAAGRERAMRPEFQIGNQVRRFDELYRRVLGS